MAPLILVVDDNETNRKLFRDILEFNGYSVAEAGDGEQGLTVAKQLTPDLILMDIQMPVMDGSQACLLLKRDPLLSRIKVIALTSFAMKGDKERFLADGFNGYLAKPINTREFPGLIKHWLEGD